MKSSYVDGLAAYGVSSAHPGSLELTRAMLDAEQLQPGNAVLDAGCGIGRTAELLHDEYKARVTAIDLHPVMVEKAMERLAGRPIEIRRGNIETCSFHSNSFDLILSESVLAFANTEKALENLKRALKKGGTLLAVEMTAEVEIPEEDAAALRDFYGFKTLRSEAQWKKIMKEAGFRSVECIGFKTHADPVAEPDFIPSENITEEEHLVMERHLELVEAFDVLLGFRVYRCVK